jgi:glycosyltransferase involved in cell wall biosynthesis
MKIINARSGSGKQMKISVIIPVYNVEKFVGKCIDSVLKQTYNNFEIIAINDGSTDGSLEILNQYVEKDSRIKIINQENQGLSGARNSGIRASKGQYLIFLDSDDTIEEALLQDVSSLALINQLDIVVYGYTKLTEGGTIVSKTVFNDQILDKNSARRLMIALKISPMACNKFYNRKLFSETGVEYPRGMLHEDIGTTYKLIWSAQRIGQLSKSYYNWFIRGDSITGSLTKKHISDVFLQFGQIQNFLDDLDEFENYKSEYLRGFFQMQNVLIERTMASEEGQELYIFLTRLQNQFGINSEENLSILKAYDKSLHKRLISNSQSAKDLFKECESGIDNEPNWKIVGLFFKKLIGLNKIKQ